MTEDFEAEINEGTKTNTNLYNLINTIKLKYDYLFKYEQNKKLVDGSSIAINNDYQNSLRLIKLCDGDFKYCIEKKQFFKWNSRYWQHDIDDEINQYQISLAEIVKNEAEEYIKELNSLKSNLADDDKKRINEFIKEAKAIVGSLHSAKGQQNALTCFKKNSVISTSYTHFNQNKHRLVLKNGTYDIQEDKFLKDDFIKNDYCTISLGCSYMPKATCEKWEKHIDTIFSGHKEVDKLDWKNYFQTLLGYFLVPDNPEQVFFWFWGRGGNGKGTVLSVIQKLLSDYVSPIPESVLEKTNVSKQTDSGLVSLRDSKIGILDDPEESLRISSGRLNALTGGNTISTSDKHEKQMKHKFNINVIISTNPRPKMDFFGEGTFRRFKLIPFEHQFKADKILKYDEILFAEIDGIFNYFLEGLDMYRNFGLKDTAEMSKLINQVRIENENYLEAFSRTCLDSDESSNTNINVIYDAFLDWCNNSQIGSFRIWDIQKFKKLFRDLPFKSDPTNTFYKLKITGKGESLNDMRYF